MWAGAYLQMFMACPTGGRQYSDDVPIGMIISCPAAGYPIGQNSEITQKSVAVGRPAARFQLSAIDTINRSNVNSGFVSAFFVVRLIRWRVCILLCLCEGNLRGTIRRYRSRFVEHLSVHRGSVLSICYGLGH